MDNEIKNEISEIAPNLSKIFKRNEFDINEEYFENFNSRLTEKIEQRNNFRKKHSFKPFLYAAAAIVAIIFISMLYRHTILKNNNKSSNDLYWDEVISSSVLVEKIDEKTLIDYLINNYGEDYEANIKISDEEIKEDDILKYLEENEPLSIQL